MDCPHNSSLLVRGQRITGEAIRLIEKGDSDRLLEAKQHVAMAKLYDDPALPTTMISPSEIAAMHPLVDVSGIECGVFTPHDGDVDPTMLTTAISRDAKADGAKFRFNAEVTADAVVNAAGLWSRRFSNQLGMAHPAFVIEHQYAITEAIPELQGRLGDGQRVPVLRDLAGALPAPGGPRHRRFLRGLPAVKPSPRSRPL